MTRRYDLLLVVDIECTCWERQPPPGQETEIIEIGLCTLVPATGERVEKRSILVRPERSTVSPFCTQLTTLTQEQVETGIAFPDACAILANEYRGRQRVWASYGDFDRQQFERQCAARGVPYPFGPTHLNVKTLFTLMRKMRHDVAMSQAIAQMGLALEGTHHRGHDDAWNIALLLAKLLEQEK